MSVTEFITDVKGNPDLADKFKSAKSPEEIVELANTNGYDITLEDLRKAHRRQSAGELSESELAGVSGGGIWEDLGGCPDCGGYLLFCQQWGCLG